jgi:hypothetical protein
VQALNLFRLSWPNILAGNKAPARHVVPPADAALRDAIDNGVPSVILRPETPRSVRMEISLLLNQTHLQKWDVDAQGRAFALPVEPELPGARKISQFEAISKVCDSEMLGSLLRGKLGIDETLADSGYEAAAADGSVKSAYRPLDAGAATPAVNSNSNSNGKAAMSLPTSKL